MASSAKPAENDLKEYAAGLGLDIDSNPDLAWIAREALVAPLPSSWGEQFDNDGNLYFFNKASQESQWSHPTDEVYKEVLVVVMAIRAEQLPASCSRREQAICEHLEIAFSSAQKELEGWSGPYASDLGPYFYNRNSDFSSWCNPADELDQQLDLRQRILQRCLLEDVAGSTEAATPLSATACSASSSDGPCQQQQNSVEVHPSKASSRCASRRPSLSRLLVPSLNPADGTPKSPASSSLSFYTPRSGCSVRSTSRSLTPPIRACGSSAAPSPGVDTGIPNFFPPHSPHFGDALIARMEASCREPTDSGTASRCKEYGAVPVVHVSPPAMSSEDLTENRPDSVPLELESSVPLEPATHRQSSGILRPASATVALAPEGDSAPSEPVHQSHCSASETRRVEGASPDTAGYAPADSVLPLEDVVITPSSSPRLVPKSPGRAPSPSEAREFWNTLEVPRKASAGRQGSPRTTSERNHDSPRQTTEGSDGDLLRTAEGEVPLDAAPKQAPSVESSAALASAITASAPTCVELSAATGSAITASAAKSVESSAATAPAPKSVESSAATAASASETTDDQGHDYELTFGSTNRVQLPQFLVT